MKQLDLADINSEEYVLRVLDQRARELARLPAAEVRRDDLLHLMAFPMGDERYAVDINMVLEIQPLGIKTTVPCTPAFVIGVVNIRGQIFSLVDLARFIGLPKRPDPPSPHMLLVKGSENGPAARMELCILTDGVPEVVLLPVRELHVGSATVSAKAQEYVKGVTNDMLTVLDLERILADPGLVIHEEV
jgi:purine-binding chemotaxis protein CheW